MPPETIIGQGAQETCIHGTTVCTASGAVLIVGASGSGKSSLALQLMALGARLVSDDRTNLSVMADQVEATAPPAIKGLIEARGVGLLCVASERRAPVKLVIDMDREEHERLPPQRNCLLLGQKRPLLFNVKAPHFPASILLYLDGGRSA